ncbi:hypothetical protein ACIQU7_24045 [Streptomyces albidoflavus]
MTDRREYPPDMTPELWLLTLDFLESNAAPTWALMMGQGVSFIMPPAVAALPSVEERGAALAELERERLATAELYHFDSAACDVVATLELRPQAVEQLAPSASGFLVWEEPPMRLPNGIPIRAASWGVAHDGGTWLSWWSDTQVAYRLGLITPAGLEVNGPLTFHEEMHIPRGAWPAQAGQSDNPVHGMVRGLLGAWSAIDMKAVEERQTPPLPRVRKAARRNHGLQAPPVRSFVPSSEGGTATSPQQIIQRTLGGMLLDRPYPGQLPAELAPWHCYMVDGGHSLLVVLAPLGEGNLPTAGGPARIEDGMVPVPVKAVLRAGWEITESGYVRASVPYDPDLGVVTDPDDDEF